MSEMNIKEIALGLNRLSCSRYSEFDDMIIEKASKLGLPLIGGTALEILGAHYNKQGFRKRSDNDLDFISNDDASIASFSGWLRANVDPKKVKVDVMHVKSHVLPKDEILNLGGILVMSPEYIIWSKTKRFLERDVTDIKWLLDLADFDKLEALIEDLGFSDKNLEDLNGVIESVSVALADTVKNTNVGCLMLAIDTPFLEDIQSMIDPEDLHSFGYEQKPHVTVFYGADIEKWSDFDSLGVDQDTDIGLLFTGLSFFKSNKFDVLKFDVHSDDLQSLYQSLIKRVGVTSSYTEYIPHSTVAYLKPGTSEKYRSLITDFLTSHKVPIRVYPTGWVYSTGDFR